ncbi:hypothetical protein HHI36_022685 [Cryptolaemus montrouzieri]|uniref:C2H2-type domain-containing protein n=1 Tax=Cryptolaemus montrouzieri TaxID=559131 RepID=A0ABD2N1B6_9CUCU
MNLPQKEIEEPFEYNEVENKTFVHHFIDANGNMWEPDTFHETHREKTLVQTNKECEAKQPVDIKEIEETKSLMNEFMAGDGKIRNQEMLIKCEDLNIEKCNEEIIPKIKVELSEGNITNLPEIIDAEGKMCHDEESFQHSIKEEEVEDEISTNENHAESIQRTSKNRQCTRCDCPIACKSNMEQHINNVHLRIKSHSCTYCDFQTAQKSYLQHHMNSVHLGIKNHKCNQCDYQAYQKNTITKHIIHAHRRHKCSQCDYQATHPSKLEKHKDTVHLGIKHHKCSQCDYQTYNNSKLKRHIDGVHLGIRNYKCSYCNYQTSLNSQLKRHIEGVHLGIKNHKCTHCDYQASRKDAVKKHINNVHVSHLTTKDYKCSHCNYKATKEHFLKLHMKNVHRDVKNDAGTM